jgi:hypothetical protein
MSRALALATALGVLSCSSDQPKPMSAIGLSLSIPKALIDVDEVKLYVYDQAKVACKDATITVPVDSVERVFELKLAKTCNAGKAWCGTGKLEQNRDRVLTFYVEGRFAAKKGGFTGCVERAVDQDPLQIDMKAQPIVEGGKCGDVAVAYGETCDPGTGVTDEACDGATCKTKEVVLSNGAASRRFFRGRPGRKTSVGARWVGNQFYGVWSDQATGFDGNDGSNEVTVRLNKESLVTETSPVVLASEVRLPATGGPNSDGGSKRGSVDLAPAMSGTPTGLLFTFIRDDKLNVLATDAKFNVTSADAVVGSATAGHHASSSTGDALIAFVDAGAVKAVFRKADGSLGAAQSVGTGSGPRVAWVGTDFVVVWSDGNDIRGRKFGSADGAMKPDFVVNTAKTAGVQSEPDVAGFATGEFLVAWKDGAGDVGADIRVQKFGAAGAPTGNEIGAVLNDKIKDGDQGLPSVGAGITPGGLRFYLVAWKTTDNIGARFVKVDEDGFLISHLGSSLSEFSVGEGARPRSSPSVAIGTASAPYCAIAWADDADGDAAGDDDRVRVRRLPMPDPPK